MFRGTQYFACLIMAIELLAVSCSQRPAFGGEQRYQLRLTDFAVLQMIFSGDVSKAQDESLAAGISEALGGRVTPIEVLKFVKELGDVEYSVRSRPNWRRDGDIAKHARGFYQVRAYLWEQVGPLRSLDYTLTFIEEGGARTTVVSRLDLDVRQFGPAHGDRLIFAVANWRPVHRLINRIATRLVQAAEWGALTGLAAADRAARDKEREQRRWRTTGVRVP